MEDNSYNENSFEQENVVHVDPPDVKEQSNVNENVLSTEVDKDQNSQSSSDDNENTTKTSARALGATGAVAAMVVLITVTITNILASISFFKPYATFLDYSIDTTIEYTITEEDSGFDIENFDTGLRLITFNDYFENIVVLSTSNTDITYEVLSNTTNDSGGKVKLKFSGKVAGLIQNTKYKTQLIGIKENGDIKVYEEKIFTTTGPKTSFSSVDWKCECSNDGYFYYTLKYVDENNYYSNFKYEFISKKTGQVVSMGDIKNPQEKQAIYVKDFSGIDFILAITYNSVDPKDLAKNKTTIRIETNVKI